MSSNDIVMRLRMMGAKAFESASKSASRSVRGIGEAATASNTATKKFSGVLDKAAGPLSTIGALSTNAAIGIGAAGTAAVGMGLKFNAGMEQSEVAFTNLLGSSEKAEKMLDRLYDISAKTPFEFPQLTKSTQRLLGFGMAAKDVIPTMTSIGDAVAGAGGGAQEIERVSTAFGQIQAKGKVSSEELLQLAESGVPAFKILGDQIGLTGEELSKKLKDGAIDAETGLSALVKGMNKRYGGMAAAQSKTFSGMLSTLKDTAAQVLGKVTMPLFEFLRDDLLPEVNKVADAIGKWANAGGIQQTISALRAGFGGKSASETAGYGGALGKVAAVGRVVGKAFEYLKTTSARFMDALKPMQPFLSNVLFPLLKGFAGGALGGVFGAINVLIPVIKVLATVLGWVGEKAKPLKPWFERLGLVLGFVFGPMALRAIGMLGKFGGIFRVVAAAAKAAYGPVKLVGLAFSKFGKIVAAVAPSIAKAVGAMWPQIRSAAGRLIEGFVGLGKDIVRGLINGIKSAPSAVIDAIGGLVPEKLRGAVGSVAGALHLPGRALGGPMAPHSAAIVGERGPEVITTDTRARVIPIPSPGLSGLSGSGFADTIVPVYLDGREITRVVSRRAADQRARR